MSDAHRPGTVILLSGASSSGKSALAGQLLPLLPGPWYLMAVDAFGAMRSTDHLPTEPDRIDEMLVRTRRGYHRAVAAFAAAGNDVVMDYPLSEPWRLDDLAQVLRGLDVVVVEVRCDVEELARREAARGDRPPGLAASQGFVYEHGVHDSVVDTSAADPAACAREVLRRMPEATRPGALERHRRSLERSGQPV